VAKASAVAATIVALVLGVTAVAQARVGAAIDPCATSKLAAWATFTGSGGSQYGGVLIRNRSSAACTLPPAPIVYIRFSGGVLRPRQVRYPGSRVVVAPGERVRSVAQWFNWCAPFPEQDEFIHGTAEIRLPGSLGRLIVPIIGPSGETIRIPSCNSPENASFIRLGRFTRFSGPSPEGFNG
jgi:hypothetical protein